MHETFQEKQIAIITYFQSCSSLDERYQAIITLGKKQSKLEPQYKTPEHIVQGCQSTVFLQTTYQDNKLYFYTEADALISAGLAVLLTSVYSGEDPLTILKNPPEYIQKLGILATLTPGRANGLASIYLRIRQEALKSLKA